MAEPITICDQVFLHVFMNDARNRDDVAKFMLLPQATDSRASSHRGRSPRFAALKIASAVPWLRAQHPTNCVLVVSFVPVAQGLGTRLACLSSAASPTIEKGRGWSRDTIEGSYGPRSWPLHATHGLARALQ